jgi:hypothetical protein
MTGVAQAAGITAATIASGRELLKHSVQLSATGLLNKLLAPESSNSDLGERLHGAAVRADSALADHIMSLSGLSQDPSDPWKISLAKRLGIETLSSLYALLHAQLDYTQGTQGAVYTAAHDILVSLREAKVPDGGPANTADLCALVKRLQVQREFLREVLPK